MAVLWGGAVSPERGFPVILTCATSLEPIHLIHFNNISCPDRRGRNQDTVQGHLAHEKSPPLGHHSRPVYGHTVVLGGGGYFYERGTPVLASSSETSTIAHAGSVRGVHLVRST